MIEKDQLSTVKSAVSKFMLQYPKSVQNYVRAKGSLPTTLSCLVDTSNGFELTQCSLTKNTCSATAIQCFIEGASQMGDVVCFCKSDVIPIEDVLYFYFKSSIGEDMSYYRMERGGLLINEYGKLIHNIQFHQFYC